MRWEDKRRSDNIEDRRGQTPMRSGSGSSGMALRFLPLLIQKLGFRGMLLVGAGLFIAAQMGIDIPALLFGTPTTSTTQ